MSEYVCIYNAVTQYMVYVRVELHAAIEKWAQLHILFDIINSKKNMVSQGKGENGRSNNEPISRFAIIFRRYVLYTIYML